MPGQPPHTVIDVGDPRFDLPLLSLIVVNIVTIVLAVADHWDLGSVMFVYWFQSVIIGVFTAIHILHDGLRDANRKADTGVSVQDVSSRRLPAVPAGIGAIFLAGFFCLHYGFFHWGYYMFLLDFGLLSDLTILHNPGILASCSLFIANHLYSFLHHIRYERMSGEKVEDLFIQPYHRIIPMHMTIIFGGIVLLVFSDLGIDATEVVLVIFLCLKTYVDVIMHTRKHPKNKAGTTAEGDEPDTVP